VETTSSLSRSEYPSAILSTSMTISSPSFGPKIRIGRHENGSGEEQLCPISSRWIPRGGRRGSRERLRLLMEVLQERISSRAAEKRKVRQIYLGACSSQTCKLTSSCSLSLYLQPQPPLQLPKLPPFFKPSLSPPLRRLLRHLRQSRNLIRQLRRNHRPLRLP
jgi:hypothetical protein